MSGHGDSFPFSRFFSVPWKGGFQSGQERRFIMATTHVFTGGRATLGALFAAALALTGNAQRARTESPASFFGFLI
jgi:hypothetical protein